MKSGALNTAMLISHDLQTKTFLEAHLQQIEQMTRLHRSEGGECTDEWQLGAIAGADIIVTGWGTRPLTTAMLDAAPNLKLMCHGAGSVRHLINARELQARGIRVCTARTANATSVAEFAFGMMLVSMKNIWPCVRGGQRQNLRERMREPYGATVGIVGASAVGREMIRLCQTLALEAILLYDPYVSPEQAQAMGVQLASLDDLMRRSDVVSLHTPAIEACRHIINGQNLPLMKDNGIFINTARGMCVDEDALIKELNTGRITACLDVTFPEPPVEGSPLYTLPNCILTPHIAGSVKENILRHGQLVTEQIDAFIRGENITDELDLTQFDRIA